MTSRERLRPYWPLFGLELRTPRLTLAPICDDDLPELMEAQLAGIHPPDQMPFDMPWTAAPPAELIPSSLKHYWTRRCVAGPDNWAVMFGVHLDEAVIGVQELHGKDFEVLRGVDTGSWLRLTQHGNGFGTEMRAAVLMFAFDHLGALRAESAAFLDNPASLNVSRKLGYRPNGRQWKQRRPGESAENERLLVAPDTFLRPGWELQVSGFAECRSVFGI